MKKNDINKQIKAMTEAVVLEVLKLNPKTTPDTIFDKKVQQAKIGMIFLRDREISDRIHNGQYIRVITLISDDKDERKRYMEITMPNIKLLSTTKAS